MWHSHLLCILNLAVIALKCRLFTAKKNCTISSCKYLHNFFQRHGPQARIQGGGGLGVVTPLLSTTNFFFQQTF